MEKNTEKRDLIILHGLMVFFSILWVVFIVFMIAKPFNANAQVVESWRFKSDLVGNLKSTQYNNTSNPNCYYNLYYYNGEYQNCFIQNIWYSARDDLSRGAYFDVTMDKLNVNNGFSFGWSQFKGDRDNVAKIRLMNDTTLVKDFWALLSGSGGGSVQMICNAFGGCSTIVAGTDAYIDEPAPHLNWVHYNIHLDKIEFFVNGVLKETGILSVPIDFTNYTADKIGIALIHTASWGNQARFTDLSIYNRPLTETELLDHYNSGAPASLYFEEGNFGDTPPTGKVLVWGYPDPLQSVSEFDYNGAKVFPIYWNLCEIYDTFDRAVLMPIYSEGRPLQPFGKTLVESKTDFTGPQLCKDTFNFVEYKNNSNSGSVYFNINLYDENDNLINTIVSNTKEYNAEITDEGYIDSINNDPLLIDLGSLPYNGHTVDNTELLFMYDFTNRNKASTTIELWNYRENTLVGTIDPPAEGWGDNGIHKVYIDTPNIQTSSIFRYKVISDGDPNILSGSFTVDWGYKTTSEGNLNEELKSRCEQMPIFDFTGVCDGIDTSSWFGSFNCGIREGLTGVSRVLFRPSCSSLLYFSDNYNDLKDTFPFNTFFDLTDSMNTAIDTAISTTTSGSIDIPFIRKTDTGSEYYMLAVASSTSFENAIGENNYKTFHDTMGFLWWVIGAIIIYFTVKYI